MLWVLFIAKMEVNMGKNKRWIALFASVLIELCAGLPYSWSVFQNLLAEKYGWALPQTAVAYSISSVVMLWFTLLLASPLMKRLGIRRFLLLGCLCYGGGTLGCGLIRSSVMELYLYYGILVGTGTAILYPTLTSYAVRLFPERSGLASGIVVAGYGCGPFVLAPVIHAVYERTHDISKAFIILGCVFLAAIFLLCLCIYEPDNNVAADSKQASQSQHENTQMKPAETKRSLTRSAMIRTPLFYIIYLVYLIGIVNGTMVVTQASPLLQDSQGITAKTAAGIVGGLALVNTFGRILWGAVSDKIRKTTSVLIMHACCLLGFGLLTMADGSAVHIAAMGLTVFSFGGFSTLLAPATADAFGAATLGENYSVMFSIFSLAGIAAPLLVTGGGYNNAYLYGLMSSAVGIGIGILYFVRESRQ